MTTGALAPYRVLDLTGEAGALCGKILAELGAQVIKIEAPAGDPTRRLGPFKDDIPHREGSLRFASLNVNKRGITLDVESEEGRRLFLALIGRADALIEDQRPGYLDGLGLGHETLLERNPGLVHASITGFGLSGPYRDYKAPDMVTVAMGGILNLSGDPALPPCMPPETQSYYVACLHAAFGTLAALCGRAATGRGQLVEIAAYDCLMCQEHQVSRYGQDGHIIQREGAQHGGAAPGKVFPTQDGFVHVFVSTTWTEFFQWIGSPAALAGDVWQESHFRRANVDVINPFVEAFTAQYSRGGLSTEGQARHTPIVPVNTPADVAKDSHMHDIGFFSEGEHPYLGAGVYASAPYQMSRTPPQLFRTAPTLGQDNAEVYGELGLTSAGLEALRATGVI